LPRCGATTGAATGVEVAAGIGVAVGGTEVATLVGAAVGDGAVGVAVGAGVAVVAGCVDGVGTVDVGEHQ
jgi:hypothetical protein